jgi:hypothetical protein
MRLTSRYVPSNKRGIRRRILRKTSVILRLSRPPSWWVPSERSSNKWPTKVVHKGRGPAKGTLLRHPGHKDSETPPLSPTDPWVRTPPGHRTPPPGMLARADWQCTNRLNRRGVPTRRRPPSPHAPWLSGSPGTPPSFTPSERRRTGQLCMGCRFPPWHLKFINDLPPNPTPSYRTPLTQHPLPTQVPPLRQFRSM